MRLFEFALPTNLRIRLIAVINQLKGRLEDSNSQTLSMSTSAFLNLLRKNGIELTSAELFDLYDKEPLNQLISNLNDTQVTFKGAKTSENDTLTASDQINATMSSVTSLKPQQSSGAQFQLDQMAKRAAGL